MIDDDKPKILVWLDDLLDTRLSSMLGYSFEKTIELIPEGYDRRTADAFIWKGLGITEEKWNKIYGQRDELILSRSVRTGMADFLRELVSASIGPSTVERTLCPAEITVNTWPYYLPTDVRDAWAEAMKEIIHPLAKVKVIRREYESLTPGYVMNNFNHLIHYDWEKWAATIPDTKEPASLTTLRVIGPRIFKTAPTEEELEKYGDELSRLDLHMLAEMAAILIFQLNLIDVDVWIALKTDHGFSKRALDQYMGLVNPHTS